MDRYLALMVFAVPQSWAQPPTAAEQELIKLENDWSEAVVKRDGTLLQRLFAEEYAFTDQDGVVWNKTQDIANVTSGVTRTSSYKLEDLKVRLYGDVAVVTGSNTIKATFQGRDIGGKYRFTDVFVKRSGAWQVVTTQGTLVAKP